jgi:carboxypeptidase PM20D1
VGAAAVGTLAAAAAVASRVASRTNDVPPSIGDRAPSRSERGVDGQRFLDNLGAAVRIDTTSHEDPTRVDAEAIVSFHRLLAERYPRVHATCSREVVNDLSLLFTWEGSDPALGPIVLMAHMDVVPVEPGTEEDWQIEPFSGIEADGYLWGRGALDDKGPLIATMEALEHLLGVGFVPVRTIHLVFGHDEEVSGFEGAARVAAVLRDRGVHPWIVLDEGGGVVDSVPMLSDEPVALVKVAEKGYVDVRLTARGQGGHSSMPAPPSAIGTLSEAIRRLEAHPMPPRVAVLEPFFESLGSRLSGPIRAMVGNLSLTAPAVARAFARRPQSDALIRTTTAVTMVSGGVKSNVLPQEAWAVANFRILPGDSVRSVLDHVRSVVGPDISVEPLGERYWEPSAYSSIESDAWRVVRTSVEETFPEAVVAPWILTGATDSRYFEPFSDAVYGFGPFTVDPELGGIHGTDERVRVADADRAVSFFCRFIRNADAVGSPEGGS